MVSRIYVPFEIRFHMNSFIDESFVSSTTFVQLLIDFIAIASVYMCNHEIFQGTA